jgi:hypothetical protein
MAHSSIVILPATSFIGDVDAQLVAGDEPALAFRKIGRPVMVFDDTIEMAAVSVELILSPVFSGSGVLTADIILAANEDSTNDVAFDIFIEAVTPNNDTLDMALATSWDSANSATISLSGTTTGDPVLLSVPLANDDSIAVGDVFRIGIRRDTDSANDDAVGNLYIFTCEIWEDV